MVKKLREWARRLIFNLIKDDIQSLIYQGAPPKTKWEVLEKPMIIERPRASNVVFKPHRTLENHLEVKFDTDRGIKKCAIKAPEGLSQEETRDWLLKHPQSYI